MSTFTESTCGGSSNYNSSEVYTGLMEQLHSLSVRMLYTQLKRCSLPTSGNKVMMAAHLHNYFQSTPSTENNNKQQKPAHQLETTCFLSNLLINCHLEIICFLSNLPVSCQIFYTNLWCRLHHNRAKRPKQSNSGYHQSIPYWEQ